MATPLGWAAGAGFVALVAVPLLVAAALVLRGAWAAWQPRALGLVEDDGGAPRLVGWLVTCALGVAAVAWTVFQGTWQLANFTAFKPLPVSLAEPALAVGAALLAVAVSRPVALAIAAGARAIDRRWQRRGRRSLLAPVRVAIAVAILLVAGLALFYRFAVRAHFGAFEIGFLTPVWIGGAVALALHVAWHYAPSRARAIAGGALVAIAVAAIAVAVGVACVRPTLALSIWSDRPLAGFAVGAVFDPAALRERVTRAEARPTERTSAHPDILLITFDSMRADHTPPYGGTANMPAIASVAARGAVFEHAFAASSATRRALPALLTGIGPERLHGEVATPQALALDPRHIALPERLAAAGYEAAVFTCCLDVVGGLLRPGLDAGVAHVVVAPDGIALARIARDWLAARDRRGDARPLFLWLHLDEHAPHYDRALADGDSALATLLDGLASRARPAIVAITAVHGEGLGEHGAATHGTDLYDSQIQVPLVIAGPGVATVRVPETVSTVELTPTLLDLAGFASGAPSGAFDGASLADLATGARAGDPDGGVAYAALIRDRFTAGGLAAVISGRWKLIDNGSVRELYDLRADPAERSNALGAQRAIADRLARLLVDYRERANRSPFE